MKNAAMGRGAAIALSVLLLVQTALAERPAATGTLEERINALLARMTLQEKVGQTVQYSYVNKEELRKLIAEGRVGSLLNARGAEMTNALQKLAVEGSRLGIPLIIGNDVIHGYRTVFPIPLAAAASWEPALVQAAETMAATEARAAGTHWTFAPMVDIARDPRWGRIAEGSGEDPFLGAVMARAKVLGFQGESLSSASSVVACPKHYVGYGAAEGGRDYNTVEMSLNTLLEIYLPPFEAAIKAGAGTIMSAFNELNGIPASANPLTLTEILRKRWGFQGFVISDWNSIGELIVHGFAADKADAAQKALRAGVDMDMEGNIYHSALAALVEEGRIADKELDEAVRRILRIKILLGLFEKPYADPALEKTVTLTPANRALVRDLARKSIVLLKNKNGLLPLTKNAGSLAVVGPLANDTLSPLGTWACEGRPDTVVTVFEGIKAAVSAETKVVYAKGCEAYAGSTAGFAEAINAARDSDIILAVMGETAAMSGEAASRATLDLPGQQEPLLKALFETKKPLVVILLNGRPLAIPWLEDNAAAILETWHLGVEHGHAVADVLFGDANPGGKLPATFPRMVGQVPLHYNHKNTGRPASLIKYTSKYWDAPNTPLYPFGFGLSYTEFEYGNLRLSAKTIGPAGSVTVHVDVKNAGARAGDEVVQLYIRDLVGSMTRPVKELKGFRRISLDPGEVKTVSFVLGPEQLGFINQALEYVVEPGTFQVWVGTNSEKGLTDTFEVQ